MSLERRIRKELIKKEYCTKEDFLIPNMKNISLWEEFASRDLDVKILLGENTTRKDILIIKEEKMKILQELLFKKIKNIILIKLELDEEKDKEKIENIFNHFTNRSLFLGERKILKTIINELITNEIEIKNFIKKDDFYIFLIEKKKERITIHIKLKRFLDEYIENTEYKKEEVYLTEKEKCDLVLDRFCNTINKIRKIIKNEEKIKDLLIDTKNFHKTLIKLKKFIEDLDDNVFNKILFKEIFFNKDFFELDDRNLIIESSITYFSSEKINFFLSLIEN